MQKTRQENIEMFFDTIHKVFHDLKNEVGFPFKKHNLSGPQIRIIFLTSHSKNGVAVKDIAQKLNVTSGAITQIIDELVKNGFVIRLEDKVDRRVIRIKLSKKTQAIFHDLKKKFLDHLEPLFNNLSDDEIQTLSTLIAKVGPTSQNEESSDK